MNIEQLRRDRGTAVAAAQTHIERVRRTAAAEIVRPAANGEPAVVGRLLTDDETAECQRMLNVVADLDTQIARAQSTGDMLSTLERLTGEPTRPAAGPTPRLSRASLGMLFAMNADYRAFIQAGAHRRTGAWTSPAVEAARWPSPYQPFQATTITEDPASGGALVIPDYQVGLVPLPTRRVVVADLCAPGSTTSNLIAYMRETLFTNAADVVKETLAKPESALVFAPATAPVRKIAHWIPASEEILEDVSAMASIIDARLRYGVDIKEEDELLNGSGVDPHILGFNHVPGTQPDLPQGTDSIMDAMLKQITAIAVASLMMPDGFVMNPADWMTVQLSKNQMGNYMGGGPWTSPQQPMLWGLPGAITPAEPAGTATVGAFRSCSQVFRREGIRVEATNSHQDFFIKNLIAIRAEERLALAIYRPPAFGKVTAIVASPASEPPAAPPTRHTSR